MSTSDSAVRRVGLSFGHLRTFNDGIGELSQQLGHGLARRALQLRHDHGIELYFHLPERLHGHFGSEVRYRATSDWQRIVHLDSSRFDLWHSLHQFNPFKAPLGARLHVQTILDLNFMHLGNERKQRKYLRRMRALARRSAALVTISEFVKSDLLRYLNCDVPVHVVPLAARDLTAIAPEPVQPLPRSPFLLHISRMAPTKNIAALIELAAHWPEMTLVLAGAASPYSREVASQARQRGLGNVLVLEDISDAQKAWLFAHCTGFLFPSLTEGFGLPPLEAMHFGKPVFLSRLTSLPEVGGDAACYFDGFEPDAMRRTIERGIEQHERLGLAATVVARARSFSWERCIEQHVALYRGRLGAPAPANMPHR